MLKLNQIYQHILLCSWSKANCSHNVQSFHFSIQHMCNFSNVAAFGIFAVEFIEYFRASTASVAWIGSILLFMVAPAGNFFNKIVTFSKSIQKASFTQVGYFVQHILQSGYYIFVNDDNFAFTAH